MSPFAEFRAAADRLKPTTAIILGSGLAGATSAYTPESSVRIGDVPGLAPAGVHGHAGKVSVGRWGEIPVVVFHGRLHFYEGHSWDTVTGTVRLAANIGVKRIILTNAAGGIHPDLNPGDLMLIRGHLKWFGRVGPRPTSSSEGVSEVGRGPTLQDLFPSPLGERGSG